MSAEGDERRHALAAEHAVVDLHHEDGAGQHQQVDDAAHQADADEGRPAGGEHGGDRAARRLAALLPWRRHRSPLAPVPTTYCLLRAAAPLAVACASNSRISPRSWDPDPGLRGLALPFLILQLAHQRRDGTVVADGFHEPQDVAARPLAGVEAHRLIELLLEPLVDLRRDAWPTARRRRRVVNPAPSTVPASIAYCPARTAGRTSQLRSESLRSRWRGDLSIRPTISPIVAARRCEASARFLSTSGASGLARRTWEPSRMLRPCVPMRRGAARLPPCRASLAPARLPCRPCHPSSSGRT